MASPFDDLFLTDAQKQLIVGLFEASKKAPTESFVFVDAYGIRNPISHSKLGHLGDLRIEKSDVMELHEEKLLRWIGHGQRDRSEFRLTGKGEAYCKYLSDLAAGIQEFQGVAEMTDSLIKGFDLGELRSLFAELGYRYDHIKHDTTPIFAREMISFCRGANSLEKLLNNARALRPDLPWPKLLT